MRLLAFFLFGALSLPIFAQDDLRQDSTFFHAQKETYQRWLEHEGLAQDLRVEDVLVTEHHVFLYLGFYTTDVDTVTEIWTQLQEAFRENGAITLEQHLFYKMVQLMELEEDQARVVLFENYDVEEAPEPCFIRGILFEDGQVRVFEQNCRAGPRDIEVKMKMASGQLEMAEAEIAGATPRKEVFDKIYAYAGSRYGRRNCEGQPARLVLREKDRVLRFEVRDLCKEVITESQAPLICQWLPIDCKERREWLIFTVTYTEITGGFKISCQIDGKVGSGYFGTIGRGAYYDMEIDFDEYLEEYADRFKLELQSLF
jgi:hypothetical protein